MIRPFRDPDEDAVVALWHACGLTRPWNDPHRDIARKRTVQPELFLVYETDGAVVASAMFGYDGHRGWVNYLGVDPAFRGCGIARALMTAGEDLLRERGCPKINLQIREDNTAALAFYAALGYTDDRTVSYARRLIED